MKSNVEIVFIKDVKNNIHSIDIQKESCSCIRGNNCLFIDQSLNTQYEDF